MLLAGKDRCDGRANLGSDAVGLALGRRQIVAGLPPEVDLRTPAMLGQMGLVGLRAGRVGPDLARRVGRIENVGQLCPAIGGRALARFSLQRASRAFCASFFGLAAHASAGSGPPSDQPYPHPCCVGAERR